MKFVTKVLIFGNSDADFTYFKNVSHPGKCGESLNCLSIQSLAQSIYGQEPEHYTKDKSYPDSYVRDWNSKMLTHHSFTIVSEDFFPYEIINAIQAVSPSVELEYYCEVEEVCLSNLPRPTSDNDWTKRMVYVPEEGKPYGSITEAIRQLCSLRSADKNPEIWIVQTAEREITPSYVNTFEKMVWSPDKKYNHILLAADEREEKQYRKLLGSSQVEGSNISSPNASIPNSRHSQTAYSANTPKEQSNESKKASNDKQFLLIMGGIALILILMGLLAKCAG